MKRIVALLVAVCFVATPLTTYAGKGGAKGPSDKAYENADDNAKFKRPGDVEETGEEYKKKKRKRVEAVEGEAQGKGGKKREKPRERKEAEKDE